MEFMKYSHCVPLSCLSGFPINLSKYLCAYINKLIKIQKYFCVLQFLVVTTGLSIYNAISTASLQLRTAKDTLTKFVKEYGAHKNVKNPSKSRKTKDFFEKLTPYQMDLIRWIMHEQFKKCNLKRSDPNSPEDAQFPTVKSVLKEINENFAEVLPPMTEKKLWICLHRLGFQYKRHPDTKNVLLIGK